ncbi:MAG: endonuclease III [Bacteroidales bacterium]|nr:endonuclease III [Bacteroidales bacterium]
MTKKERYRQFIEYFSVNQPDVKTELTYSDPYQLLVAVILSAQCTDKRVNMLTPSFFNKFPNPAFLASAQFEEVFNVIKSCSYPNNKTKHLIGMAQKLIEDFDGVVPSDIDNLQKLPGVGRKTANVIASVFFNQPAMAVDTHVFRVSKRIGLTTNPKNPLDTEKQLVKFIPKEYISRAHHWLILHGRYVCIARKPKCDVCKINYFCKYYQSNVLNTNPALNNS